MNALVGLGLIQFCTKYSGPNADVSVPPNRSLFAPSVVERGGWGEGEEKSLHHPLPLLVVGWQTLDALSLSLGRREVGEKKSN